MPAAAIPRKPRLVGETPWFHPSQQPRRRRHRGRRLRGRTAQPHAVLPQPSGDRRVYVMSWALTARATSCRRFVSQRSTEKPARAQSRHERQVRGAPAHRRNDRALPGHRAPGQPGGHGTLTAEMVDMIEHGCPNHLRPAPRACPTIVGKGMPGRCAPATLRPRQAADYDPSLLDQLSSTASSSCSPHRTRRRAI